MGRLRMFLALAVLACVIPAQASAASTITVETEQRVVSTGLYGLVRHPMYFGALIMMVGVPLALDSYWGLVTIVPMAIVLVFRILDEEQALSQELAGYTEYTQKVHSRLVPYVW